MPRYREADVYAVLWSIECEFDGDLTRTGQIWYTAGGHVFTIPKPVDGYFDADVIDRIMSDRWLPKPNGTPERLPD